MTDEETTETTETTEGAQVPAVDDQGGSEPVVPTDLPVVQDAATWDVTNEALAAALARIAELEAEVADLRGSGTGSKRAQRSNSRSARVARYEEAAFQGAVAGWERDTGQVYEDFADPPTEPTDDDTDDDGVDV